MVGSVAQLVEQRPEEPCVVGSSPTGATKKIKNDPEGHFLFSYVATASEHEVRASRSHILRSKSFATASEHEVREYRSHSLSIFTFLHFYVIII